MTTQPIAGNQNFSVITNAAAQLSELNVGKLTTSSIDGKFTEYTVTGYAPTGFASAAVGAKLNLNKAPGLPQASATTDANLLRIPKRVKVVSVYATNNGTTIVGSGAVLDVGLNAALATSPSPLSLDDTPIASCNTGVLGMTGAGGTGDAGTTTETFGAVEVKTAALTAGDLKVRITLMALP